MVLKISRIFLIKIIFTMFIILDIHAITLKESVKNALQNNPQIISLIKNQEAFKKYIDEEEADYWPTLNLNAYTEKSNYDRNYKDNTPNSNSKVRGWNASLTLEQVLYDGGLTASQAKEFRHNYKSNYLKNQREIENVIYDTVDTYLNIVKYNELKSFSELYRKQQVKNKEVALKKEEISGEKLEVYQVDTKYNQATDKYLDNDYNLNEALNNYRRFVGIDFDNIICKPTLDESFIPKSSQQIKNIAYKKSYDILEQIEKIKLQREKIAQNSASFLPKLSFQLVKSIDNDIALENNGEENLFSAKFQLSWNLFSGGKNIYASQRERLFLEESKKQLEDISNDVASRVDSIYRKFIYEKKKVENLRVQAENSVNIVAIYKKEFEAGTRSLIDILNAQAELFRSSIDLIDKEFEIYKAYYKLLKEISFLNDAILMDNNFECSKFENEKLKNNFMDKNNTQNELSDDLIAIFEPPQQELLDENKNNTLPESESNLSQNLGLNEASLGVVTNDKNSSNLEYDLNKEKKDYGEIDANSLTKKLLEKIYKELEIAPNTKSIHTPKSTKNIDKKKSILDLDKMSYTINLATLPDIDSTYKYIMKNNLENECMYYSFGKNPKFKIVCGSYKTFSEAKNSIKNFSGDLRKSLPYVDNIDKHQKLFKKYNN